MNIPIQNLTTLIAVFGVTTGAPPRLRALQSAAPLRATPVVIHPGIPASEGELSAAVQARIARGDVLTGMRRYTAAEREYRVAAEIARREGHLPSLTLWHLASAHYYAGDLPQAAAVLTQLADEAARCGDVVVQALALYDAAWLNGQRGLASITVAQVTNLKALLRSPYMPFAVRDYLTARLSPPAEIADRR